MLFRSHFPVLGQLQPDGSGGDAQTKAMKSAAGAIRLELAQYREMEVFTQFSSDLDEATKRQLAYGQGLMRLLRQPQYAPLSQHQQVILLVCAMGHVMQTSRITCWCWDRGAFCGWRSRRISPWP